MEIEEIIRLLPLLLGGKASKEQEKEVSRWLEEDEGNPVLYKELCATYYKLHYACRWTDIDPVAASSKIRSGLEKKSVRLRLTAWVSGVAAILVAGLCISYFIHREDSVIPERIIVKDVKSGEKKALLTLADGRQVELKADHQVNMDLGTVTAIEYFPSIYAIVGDYCIISYVSFNSYDSISRIYAGGSYHPYLSKVNAL